MSEHNYELLWFPQDKKWIVKCRYCGKVAYELVDDKPDCSMELPTLGISVREEIKVTDKVG